LKTVSNLPLARLALVPPALMEIAYVYFYVTRLYALPKIGRLAACGVGLVIVTASTLGPVLIWQSIVGVRRGGNDDPIFSIIFTHASSAALMFYLLLKRRQRP
jgi:hypothetical protein